MWQVVKPLGAIDIQPHVDVDAWLIRFPPRALESDSAGDLANRLWARPDFVNLATVVPFRAGRGSKPVHWWVGFQLKAKEPPNAKPSADRREQTEAAGDRHDDVSEGRTSENGDDQAANPRDETG
jgi:hypothetical protein